MKLAAERINQMTKEVIDMVVKAAIGFLTADSDAQLVLDTQAAIEGLTNNTSFPTPNPMLASITTALTAFTTAIAEAANGGKELTSAKNAKRAELVSLMRQLASYVTITSNGDMTKLLSSSFPYQTPTRTTIGTLPAPDSPVLKLGTKSGEIDASVTPIYGAYVYNWRVALSSSPNTFVQTVQTTGGRNTFEGLTPGQSYIVEANAVGSAGPSDWSNASESMVV
jgi:hypothetical protein